jgi:dienelactone hydrolase
MRFPIVFLAALAFGATGAAAAANHAAETVDIPAGSITLKAALFRPAGDGPFPAVIGLHSCTGLSNARGITTRYRDWGERLSKAGFLVLFPDSYGSRGLGNLCRVRGRAIRSDRERMADAEAARRWLQDQPFVRADHISLLGWSNGGSTALWTIRPRAAPTDGKPDFRSAVAFYPGCNRLANAAWSARIPTLILIGAADDQASAKACEQMVAGARDRSARISLVIFPGAFHDFDHPGRPVEVRGGYAFSVDGTGRVHTGTDPAARADVLRRVPNWLMRY